MAIKRLRLKTNKVILLVGATCGLFGQTTAVAMNFIFTPSLTVRGTYSDNIRLAAKGLEQGAFVTEISPGLSIRGVRGGRLTGSLDYRLQTLFNSGGDGSTRIFNQLQLNTAYQIVRNRLYVQGRSTVSQQNINNIRTSDNINGLNSRTNVYTAGVSPIWTPHFGSFANAVVRVDFNYVANDNFDFGNNTTANGITDSMNVSESVQLRSGRDFQRITWVAGFNNNTSFRDNGEDVHFQNASTTVRGWVNRRFNFFATGTYANNGFQGLNRSTNGFGYTVGAQWIPNWYFNAEAGYGNNWFVSANFNPTRRTRFRLRYDDRSVGLNTGGAWTASASHRTKRSFWQFSYKQDTTTIQNVLLNQSPFNQNDVNGNPLNSQAGQNVNFDPSLPSLTNDVVIRRTANASASYNTGRSTFRLGGFHQRRDFSSTDNGQERIYGADVSWNWRFMRRTSLFVSPSWQTISRNNTATGVSVDDRYQAVVRLTRTVPWNSLHIGHIGRSRVLNVSLEYRFLQQHSNLVDNTYMENRLTASIFMNF